MDNRLKKRSDFDKAFQKGKKLYGKTLMLVFVPAKELKIGYSVGKKHGGAVVRNRVKRLLRAAMRKYIPIIKGNYHMVIVPRAAEDYTLERFERDITFTLAKEKLIESDLCGD